MESLMLEDGKYCFYLHEKTGTVYCDRYGKGWRIFTGDKAISALFAYAHDMKNKLEEKELQNESK